MTSLRRPRVRIILEALCPTCGDLIEDTLSHSCDPPTTGLDGSPEGAPYVAGTRQDA